MMQNFCPKYAQNAGLNVLKDVWDYNKMIVISFLKKYFIIKTSEGYL